MPEGFFWIRAVGLIWLIWGGYWCLLSLKVAKTEYSESYASRAFHLVPLAISFMLLFSDPLRVEILDQPLWRGVEAVRICGLLLAGWGIGFSIWARSHLGKYWSGTITLKEGHRLIRSGPYRYVRHPIYTGMLSGFLGSALALGRARAFLGFAIITVAFLAKMKREENTLLSRFGDEYQVFRRETPALIPFIPFRLITMSKRKRCIFSNRP